MKQQLPGVDAKLQKITEDKRREEKRSISARVFHSISFSAILSSSSSTVSLVRQSSPPHHASDDAATCFHRRRARRCLNAWRYMMRMLRTVAMKWCNMQGKIRTASSRDLMVREPG
ncbi:uncharacterized protein LOC127745686 isoform X1 [Arachis duranensis]|uniref:Uncharacterized protein LOC127745686 isoform X1 n=1 Tax=Arachis duranensis TaxID=130453 RepID=A0A9C6TJ15_ARADU|nr:uncharacterized protein LOC127745686 isoform X1 [Arachis duranensis]